MPSGIFVIRGFLLSELREAPLMETKWSVYYPKNHSAADLSSSFTLYERLIRVCDIYQSRTAIEYMGSKMSYAALAKNITRTALMWKNLGVIAGDKVLLCMGECPDMIFSIFALDALGAAAVLMIPNSSSEHFEKIANDTGAKYCLMSFNQYENYARSISDTGIGSIVIGKYSDYITGIARHAFKLYPLSSYDAVVPSFRNRKEPDFKAVTWREAMSASEAASSSGSFEPDRHNMRPCVMLEADNDSFGRSTCVYNASAVNIAANLAMFIHKENENRLLRPSRVLCLNEICFSFGFTAGMADILFSGQTLILFTWYDTSRTAMPIMRYHPDTVVGYSGTVARLNEKGINRIMMKPVSMIICGGGLLSSTQKAELLSRSERSDDDLRICTLTGCDESMAFAYTPERTSSDRMIGIPLPGIFMKIADSETGEDMAAGKPGEIAVCSPVSYLGRIKDEKITSVSLRHLPDGRDWLFTGIIGKMDNDGFFSLINMPGRVYKINSFPVYPAQVDRVISMVAGVIDVCSMVIEDVSGPKLIAAVVPSEELLFDNDMLADLKNRIMDECMLMLHEAMCPSEVEFLTSIPKDSSGNKDYESLKERINLGNDTAEI